MKAVIITLVPFALFACATEQGQQAAASSDTRQIEGGARMSLTKILITTDKGSVAAKLEDNEATRSLVRMLPLTIEMQDHLRQEKTGKLPSPLPEMPRQLDFSVGTIGIWDNRDFVIYYSNGRVPRPGIIPLGRVTGDLSVFDNPANVTIHVRQAD